MTTETTPAVTVIKCDKCHRDDLGQKPGYDYMILSMQPISQAIDGAYWPGPTTTRHLCAECNKILQAAMEAPPIDIVFTKPDDHNHEQVFVEVEREGESISYGAWIKREDGYFVLRVPDMSGGG